MTNWTPEQWYQWARIQAEIEQHWMEMQRMQQRRADREMRRYSQNDMTDQDKRTSAWSGFIDLVVGFPLLLFTGRLWRR